MNKEQVTELLTVLHSRSKGRLRRALAYLCVPAMRDRRTAYLNSIAKVKTIWQVDTSVDVQEFYYPQRIQKGEMLERIESPSTLVRDGPIVVEGIAGQGKSIFLRYLALRAATTTRAIPVFLQLRHISKDVPLSSLVRQTMTAMIGELEPIALEYLLRNKLITFMLDGFDEIHTDYRNATIQEIHGFLDSYQNYPIIVTSRPNSDIQNSALFNIARIDRLSDKERLSLISHLVDDPDTRNRLSESLIGKPHIANVLTTPLLVTLLIITYKSVGDIPDYLSEFYRSLFSTLLKRHDKMKPGFVRQRRTQLGDIDFERVFETLCFLALNDYKLDLDDRELHAYLRQSLTSLNFDLVRENDYAEDLTQVTSLLIPDGDRYFFLHKSIPEYFAAQKIAEESDVTAKDSFYRQLATSHIPENWYQTIFFLSEIDNLSYVELLLLPKLRELFLEDIANDIPRRMPPLTKEMVMRMLGTQAKLFVKRSGDNLRSTLQTSSENWFANVFLRRPLEAAIQEFVDALPDYTAIHLHSIARGGFAFDDALDAISGWPAFLLHATSHPSILQAYTTPLQMHKAIQNRIRHTRPLLILNNRGY